MKGIGLLFSTVAGASFIFNDVLMEEVLGVKRLINLTLIIVLISLPLIAIGCQQTEPETTPTPPADTTIEPPTSETPTPTPAPTATPTPIPSPPDPTPQLSNPTQIVKLNYGEHKSVTYQQIKDTLVTAFNRDIEWA